MVAGRAYIIRRQPQPQHEQLLKEAINKLAREVPPHRQEHQLFPHRVARTQKIKNMSRSFAPNLPQW